MAITLDTVKPGMVKSPRLNEVVKMVPLDKRFMKIRILNKPWLAEAKHWVPFIGKKGETKIPKNCLGFDNQNDELVEDDCPYCTGLEGNSATPQKSYFVNVLVRSLQEEKPATFERPTSVERKSGYMDGIESNTWTPVRVLRLPTSLVKKIQDLAQLNVHRIDGKKKQVNVSDPQYGVDINIKYDKEKPGMDMYTVQLDGVSTALDEEEQAYICWNLEDPNLFIKETYEQAKKEVEKFNGGAASAHDGDDDDAPTPKKRPKVEDLDMDDLPPAKPTARKRPPVEDDEEDLPPAKPVARKRPDPEDDEDELPPAKPVARKRPPVDDDDELPPAKPAARKRPALDDDDDLPPAKPAAGKRPAASKNEDENVPPWEDEDEDA